MMAFLNGGREEKSEAETESGERVAGMGPTFQKAGQSVSPDAMLTYLVAVSQ
jgi:phage-related protein